MHIAIDGNEANIENKVGVHQYAFEILKALYAENEKLKLPNTFTVYLKYPPRRDLPEENERWKYKMLSGGKVWIVTKLMPQLLLQRNIDVFFSPSHYLPPLLKQKSVCTIHDLGYLESSEQFKKYDFWQLKLWTAKSISVSNRLIAVSNSTKQDIVRHYGFASKKIDVVHHGYDKKLFNTNISPNLVRRVKEKYGIKGDYILFLSTLKPSKNIEGLIHAFSLLKSGYKKPVSLVIAGKKGWLYEEIFNTVKSLNLQDSVVFTDFVTEEEKPALYYGARVFALPVFWEGFGMTAIESMACGTPVVVSKVGGLPEVVGNAGLYVNPSDSSDIKKGLLEVITKSEKAYNQFVKMGLERVKLFSWEKAARDTLTILESVV